MRFLSPSGKKLLTVALSAVYAAAIAAPVPGFTRLEANSNGTLSAPGCTSVPHLLNEAVHGCSPQDIQAWLDELRDWRTQWRSRTVYSDELYWNPALRWVQSSFIQPQLMMQDRYFYDPIARTYTVDRYLDDVQKRYGGIDAVLIWHTYPNLGLDERNQYDLLRDMPGGIPAIKHMVADFHRHGVKVLFPTMVWDRGTRDESKPDWIAGAELMKEIGADGINGDTMKGVPQAYNDAAFAVDHPLALEPELALAHDEMLAWNVSAWGYWNYPYAPEISRNKWLEPRSMVHLSDRWNHDHTNNLQAAFFNGIGFESWENIWGIWNGITPHDDEAIRRIGTMERGLAPFLVSADWQPYYPTEMRGLFASYFPLGSDAVWTLVNRSDVALEGSLLRVKSPPTGAKFYDVYHGVELLPVMDGDDALLSFAVEPDGYGAILQTPGPLSASHQALLAQMKKLTQQPLASFSKQWQPLLQKLVDIPATQATAAAPVGMLKIPAATSYRFRVNGREIEGQDSVGVDFQYPWEVTPRRYHDHVMKIPAFWMDTWPVTNAQFKQFLDTAHYRPVDPTNFLRTWKDGTYPTGWGDKPVTWVSLEDARAYARWAGKRLPHEWEWQYAAQGTDGRIYPWGDAWNAAAVPVVQKGRRLTAPDAVGTHPLGASPFGIQDMVGTVWQWTDEYQDEHTRAAVLRGGSDYQPGGSIWYFPQAWRNDEHGKLLLMAPSEDRSGTVGFRCVMDIG